MICASCGEPTASDPCDRCRGPALLGGRYRLDEVISRGRVATTYRGTELSQGWAIAVKEHRIAAMDPKRLELARREAGVLRQLRHPGIPSYLDDVVAGNGKRRALFLVQEFIHGHTLQQERQRHRYDDDEVLDVLEELLGILRYLHSLSPPILHRDLSLSNVMRRLPQRRLVLVDFASVRDAMADPALGGDTVAGTFGYMAPEQFAGDASPGADLYGLGAVGVALLTRKEPSELSRAGGGLSWEPHVAVRPSLAALLSGLLAPDPADRIDADEAGRLIRAARKERERVRPSAPEVETAPEVPASDHALSRRAPERGGPPPGPSVRAARRERPPGPRAPGPRIPDGPVPDALPGVPHDDEPRVHVSLSRWVLVLAALMAMGIAMAGLGAAFVTGVFDDAPEEARPVAE